MIQALGFIGLVAMLGFCWVSPVMGATINITPNPQAISVLEGQPGVFDFMVTNGGTVDFTIKDVRLVGNKAGNSIDYFSGDRRDEVWNTALVLEANCEGKTLGPGGTCTFQQTFQTRDNDKPHSDTNSGVWLISNIVELTTGEFEDAFGKVEVRDPGAPSAIPVPPALALMGGALATLNILRRKERPRQA